VQHHIILSSQAIVADSLQLKIIRHLGVRKIKRQRICKVLHPTISPQKHAITITQSYYKLHRNS